MQPAGLVLVDRALTGGTPPARLDGRPAGVVPRGLGRLAVARAPVGQKAERAGLLVGGVEEGGPAGRAGVQKGDLIVAAGGTPTESVEALYTALDAIPSTGGELELTVVRGTDERTVTAT